ncbi:hypothetical protein KFL_002080180 [Klebsormidium nitens]|uniref:thiopurine S-methyltransferase n=1 Tax=Klebsormidium nitens TaxID=105231 RepID=A0A1Y1I6T1_KLENI|nr:hypothetical protein KFL_002080180 [Klebsormidium nitens]|eukprot:GAQ84841.1 hypothetical protein KFL_002080180 [Klebsormidium nitens]
MAAEAKTQPETSHPAKNVNEESSEPTVAAGSESSRPDDPQERLTRWVAGWAKPRDAPGRIAFHKADPNPNLLKNLEKFLGPEQEAGENRRVLVPLCGKTVDMPFLSSKGLDVVGVEGIQTAIDEFREEHPDIPLERLDRTSEGGFEVYAGPGLSILRGDFFELTSASAGTFDLCLDRAALVAVHPSLRGKYVAALDGVLKPGARILLVGMNYNQEEMSGPPYSIDIKEVDRLFGNGYDAQLLTANDVLKDYPNFVAKGCTALKEDAFLLVKR